VTASKPSSRLCRVTATGSPRRFSRIVTVGGAAPSPDAQVKRAPSGSDPAKDWIGPPSRCCPSPNLSGDPQQDYFSDAISEDITTELSQFSERRVIARNSSFQYKGKAVDIRHADSSLVPSFRRRLPDDNSEKGL